jgi:cytochrome c peroxidase
VNKHFKPFLKKIMLAALPLFLAFSHNALALDIGEEDYDLKLLGKYVFFDKISNPPRMACVTCHDPDTGGTGSVSGVNLHQVGITGANPHTAGKLKPPTNAYASFIQPFEVASGFGAPGTNGARGGNFWDGRAEGNSIAVGTATEHIGEEVFQGADTDSDPDNDFILAYSAYFGPTADQALQPIPNVVEQNKDRQAVCDQVEAAKYAALYEEAWGEPIDCRSDDDEIDGNDPYDISFKRLMLAVCAWQHSSELNSFSSKRDIALRAELACLANDPDADPDVCSHENYLDSPGKFPLVGLTDQENLGHDLFYNVRPIPFIPRPPIGPGFNLPPFPDLPEANCSFCHSDNPRPVGPPRPGQVFDDGSELEQLYADDAYHNIGTPFNPEIPGIDLDSDDPDKQPPPGLANHTGVSPGFWKTPTLRNVDKRKGKGFIKAYAHNGWFKSMESIVHFYNTANVGGATAASFGITACPDDIQTEKDALANNCWPAPEFGGPVGGPLVGNLGMNAEQEAALVAYMRTFTDTVTPKAPKPYKPAK